MPVKSPVCFAEVPLTSDQITSARPRAAASPNRAVPREWISCREDAGSLNPWVRRVALVATASGAMPHTPMLWTSGPPGAVTGDK